MENEPPLDPRIEKPGLESGSRRSRIVGYTIGFFAMIAGTIYIATSDEKSSIGYFIGLGPIAAVACVILVIRAARERG
jgi:hypothetical protein